MYTFPFSHINYILYTVCSAAPCAFGYGQSDLSMSSKSKFKL